MAAEPEPQFHVSSPEVKRALPPLLAKRDLLLGGGFGHLNKLTGLLWARSGFSVPEIYLDWLGAASALARGEQLLARGYFPDNPLADNLLTNVLPTEPVATQADFSNLQRQAAAIATSEQLKSYCRQLRVPAARLTPSFFFQREITPLLQAFTLDDAKRLYVQVYGGVGHSRLFCWSHDQQDLDPFRSYSARGQGFRLDRDLLLAQQVYSTHLQIRQRFNASSRSPLSFMTEFVCDSLGQPEVEEGQVFFGQVPTENIHLVQIRAVAPAHLQLIDYLRDEEDIPLPLQSLPLFRGDIERPNLLSNIFQPHLLCLSKNLGQVRLPFDWPLPAGCQALIMNGGNLTNSFLSHNIWSVISRAYARRLPVIFGLDL